MIAIIKYNAGNVASIQNAINRAGYNSIITDDPGTIQYADKVIFPGVGEASSAMTYLRERGLDEVIKSLKQPVLGICLGLQLMCSYSEEGATSCLNIFPNKVRKFSTNKIVPHMGWNEINLLKSSLFDQIISCANVYYVHSYFADISESTIASTEYGESFSAALQKNNFYACQFHPEKSGMIGQKILNNFLAL